MVLRNPTDNTVSIQIDGTVYSVSANSVTKELPESVIAKWKGVHGFLLVEEAVVEVKKEETPEKPTKVEQTEVRVEKEVKTKK